MARWLLSKARLASPIMISSANGVRRILFLLSGLALSGMILAWWLGGTFAGHPDPRTTYSAFYVIFARDEVLGLALVAVFGIAAALIFFGKGNRPGPVAEIPGRFSASIFS